LSSSASNCFESLADSEALTDPAETSPQQRLHQNYIKLHQHKAGDLSRDEMSLTKRE